MQIQVKKISCLNAKDLVSWMSMRVLKQKGYVPRYFYRQDSTVSAIFEDISIPGVVDNARISHRCLQ